MISTREVAAVDAKASNRLSPNSETAQGQPTLGISPKRVKTFTVKPDGTIIAAAPEPVQPAAETAVVAASEVAKVEPTSTAVSIDGAQSTGTLAVPEPSPLPVAQEVALAAPVEKIAAPVEKVAVPKPVVKAVKPAKPVTTPAPAKAAEADPNAPTQIANLANQDNAPAPSVSSSDWKIQVSSQRSRDAAESSFNNMRNRFGSILGNRSADIQRADVDGKGTFYRVKVLAPSKEDASKLCARLQSAGGSCFVTR